MFIVLEGADGFGKSTQVSFIESFLRTHKGDKKVIATKEPGSPHIDDTKAIREMLFNRPWSKEMPVEVFDHLFLLDHWLHKRWVVEQLNAGVSVVSDRWLYSQLAYGAVKGSTKDFQQKYHDMLTDSSEPKPDLVFWFTGDPEMAWERAQQRRGKTESQDSKKWGDQKSANRQIDRLYGEWALTLGWHPIEVEANDTPEHVFEKLIPFLDIAVSREV